MFGRRLSCSWWPKVGAPHWASGTLQAHEHVVKQRSPWCRLLHRRIHHQWRHTKTGPPMAGLASTGGLDYIISKILGKPKDVTGGPRLMGRGQLAKHEKSTHVSFCRPGPCRAHGHPADPDSAGGCLPYQPVPTACTASFGP